MYDSNAPGAPLRAGGVPVSGVYYNRASSVIAGGEAGLRAGVGGVSIGRAGWASPDGVVLNARTSAQDIHGIVAIQGGDWRRVFWDEASLSWKIRQGLNLTMIAASPGLWVTLDGGGSWRERIYADPLDGRLIASYAAQPALESTRWAVAVPVGPGGFSLITTWNNPNDQ